MPKRKKLMTPYVISMIRPWRDQGLSTAEIAQKIGCTVGSLRVTCSQLKISLRRPQCDRELSQLLLELSPGTLGRLQARAALKGLHHSHLAAALLNIVAQDDLYDAVLDDRIGQTESSIQGAHREWKPAA